jgi:hypothetical protein
MRGGSNISELIEIESGGGHHRIVRGRTYWSSLSLSLSLSLSRSRSLSLALSLSLSLSIVGWRGWRVRKRRLTALWLPSSDGLFSLLKLYCFFHLISTLPLFFSFSSQAVSKKKYKKRRWPTNVNVKLNCRTSPPAVKWLSLKENILHIQSSEAAV